MIESIHFYKYNYTQDMESTIFKPKLIVIVGPTASGKSTLAVKIAERFNGEIVSADSRQIYRGMDIGTAKPEVRRTSGISNFQFPIFKQTSNHKFKKSKQSVTEPVIAEGIPHYLIDIKNPDEEYTVAQYKKDAVNKIKKIIKGGKLPILAGGTGLYVKAVVENLEIPEVKPNPVLRKKLEMRIEKEGLATVYRELVEQDPEAAYIVDGKNPRRVIRALEIAITTKKPFSAQRKKGDQLFDTLQIGIILPQEKLRKRIETRVDEMMKDGLVNEVNGLMKKYGNKPIAFDAIGYREIIALLRTGGRADQRRLNAEDRRKIQRMSASNQRRSALLNDAVEQIKKNTWAFAKRQMTWFKKDSEIKWVRNEKEATALIKKFLPKT